MSEEQAILKEVEQPQPPANTESQSEQAQPQPEAADAATPATRQSSRHQQQQHNNASTSNGNHSNQSNSATASQHIQVNIGQIVQWTHMANNDPSALNDLAVQLEKVSRSKDSVFLQYMPDRSDPLAQLIPGQHTLTLLYILSDRISRCSSDQDIGYFLPYVSNFANACEPYQLTLAPNRVHHLAERLSGLTPRNPLVVFEPLYKLITAYTSFMPETLTSLHPILAFHVLVTGNYAMASEFIDQTFIDCDRNASPITHMHALEYYYAAGLLNIKLNRLEAAEDMFEMCVTFPAQAVTAIQIEAYKKLCLVQLLLRGKMSDLPKYVSSYITRAIKNKAQVYTKFAQAYEHPDKSSKDIRDQAEKDREAFHNDQNAGLVIQCLNLHIQRRIQRLSRVYSCLYLEVLSDLIDDERPANDLAETLDKMNRKGWIICRIEADPASGNPTVNFLNNEEKFNDVKSIQKIVELISEGKRYDAIAIQRERKMSRSAAFLTKQGQPSRGDRFGGMMGGDDEDFDDEMFG